MVDELEGAAAACGGGFARDVLGEALAEIGGVASVEVAVLDASENVDVVHGLGIGRRSAGVLGCWKIACFSAPYVGPRRVRASCETTGFP